MELGVPIPPSPVAFAGMDFGDTAGEEVVDEGPSGWDVMYAFSWAERVRYLAMFRWQLSRELVLLGSDCSPLSWHSSAAVMGG